jgi:hypothetical protein
MGFVVIPQCTFGSVATEVYKSGGLRPVLSKAGHVVLLHRMGCHMAKFNVSKQRCSKLNDEMGNAKFPLRAYPDL